MTDLALIWADGTADLDICCNDLKASDDLDGAVMISLFTDKRAPDGVELPPGANRGGWWGDSYPDIEGDAIGSHLWLLSREKQTDEVLARAQGYARTALQWLLDDSVASSVVVTTSYPQRGLLAIGVEVTESRGGVRRFAYAINPQGQVCKCPPLWPFDDNAQSGGVNNPLASIGT